MVKKRKARFKVTTALLCTHIVFICMLPTILTDRKLFIILDVPKILGQIQDWVSHTKTRKNVHTNGCWQRVLVVQPKKFCSWFFKFYLCGRSGFLVCRFKINKDTSPKHSKACLIIRNQTHYPRTCIRVRESMIRRGHVRIDSGGGILSIVVSCGLINSKKSIRY